MQDRSLVQCGAQRPVQAVLQVELALPLHHVREQVAVERGVVGEQRVEREFLLRGRQRVHPHLPGRDHRPVARGQAVIGIGAAVTNRFEDQGTDLRSLPREGAPTVPP